MHTVDYRPFYQSFPKGLGDTVGMVKRFIFTLSSRCLHAVFRYIRLTAMLLCNTALESLWVIYGFDWIVDKCLDLLLVVYSSLPDNIRAVCVCVGLFELRPLTVHVAVEFRIRALFRSAQIYILTYLHRRTLRRSLYQVVERKSLLRRRYSTQKSLRVHKSVLYASFCILMRYRKW